MFKKRLLLGLAASSILLASLMISSFTLSAPPPADGMTGSLYQRSGSVQVTRAYHLDFFCQYYKFNHEKSSTSEQKDVSNYFINLS